MTAGPAISAVVVSFNEGGRLRQTIEQLRATLSCDSEIIVVDDGSDDGSADALGTRDARLRVFKTDRLGIASARNFGARHSTGEILVFSDAHVTVQPGWCASLVALLAQPQVAAVGPVIYDVEQPWRRGFGQRFKAADLSLEWLPSGGDQPVQVPVLPGGFWAMRRDVFERSGGFDDGMVCWGSEDAELSLRLWLLGYELWLAPQVEVGHLFHDYLPYKVEWSWIIANRLRLALLHLNDQRIAETLEALRSHEHFAAALAQTLLSEYAGRRAKLLSARLYDDAWYFQKFGLALPHSHSAFQPTGQPRSHAAENEGVKERGKVNAKPL